MLDHKPVHIAKYLARCGVGSRNACARLVETGHVRVNDAPCNPGDHVRAGIDIVEVDGTTVIPAPIEAYLIHKPPGLSCADAVEIIPQRPEAVRTTLGVGLPIPTEADGAILAVSDAALGAVLQGPRCCITRGFILSVRRNVDVETLSRLRRGIAVEDGETIVRIMGRVIHEGLESSLLRINVAERHRKHIRHVFQVVGHTLLEQHSVALGPIALDSLPRGKARPLTPDELNWLEHSEHQTPLPAAL